MKRFTYTGSLFAVAIAAYGGAAYGQGACQQDIEQLRTQAQEGQLNSETRQSINALLSAAQNASDQECQQIVSDAREQLSSAEGQQSTQVAQADSQQGAQSQQRSQSAQQSQSAGQQQSRAQGEQSEETTDVRVQQPPADINVATESPQVTVEQRQPTVTVDQPAPDVTITQPEPQVTVNQPEPEVTVDQAEPQVNVQTTEPEVQVTQAEPEVRVNQAGEPNVEVRSDDESSQQRASSERDQSSAITRQESETRQAATAQGGSISETDAAELVGNSVRTREGEDIGEISGIARSRTDQQLHALVDVGGFLGIGERTVTVPLERAQMDQDGNVITQMSRQEIEQMQEYDEQQYATIEEQGDQRLLR